MQEIELNGSKVFVLPVIKGLVSDGDEVRTAIMDARPDAVGISISREELEGLRTYQGEEIELSDLEEAYKAGLSEFGEVQLPPPCYLEALKACDELGIPIIPLDMNEELFSDRYCELVGSLELMKESFFSHRIARKRFDLESAGTFVLDYDRKVNGGRGVSALNAEREEHMARAAEEMAGGRSKVLLLLELERAGGIEARLTDGRGR